uniref:Uncharacterized protein n=1 Tax=Rhizophora mucronata TaxID=61149 RepID=A0A2P2PC24_RHIMU
MSQRRQNPTHSHEQAGASRRRRAEPAGRSTESRTCQIERKEK